MSDDEVYKTRDPRLKKRENQPGPPGRIVKEFSYKSFILEKT